MSISYTREMRKRAKEDGNVLISIDAPGINYQGPETKENAKIVAALAYGLVAGKKVTVVVDWEDEDE